MPTLKSIFGKLKPSRREDLEPSSLESMDPFHHLDWNKLARPDLYGLPSDYYGVRTARTTRPIDSAQTVQIHKTGNGPWRSAPELDLPHELFREMDKAVKIQRISKAREALANEGIRAASDDAIASIANVLHRTGTSLAQLHAVADWLEVTFDGFDRMKFLTACDTEEETQKKLALDILVSFCYTIGEAGEKPSGLP